MGYKDLLVVLDADPRSRERILLAAALAERFDAHLVGLYIAGAAEKRQPSAAFEGPGDRRGQPGGEDARAVFEEAAGRRSLSAEWRMQAGDPTELAALHGRYADLAILAQIDPASAWRGPRPEDVAARIGRPVLIIPYIGAAADLGRRVLVGWDGSREATRAIHDAMPFLRAASSVTVLAVDPEHKRDVHGEIPGADISLHLARHGVTAEVECTSSGGIGVGNVLLSRASDLGADLLVMGAYGHSQMRERVLGGATRTVLASMTLPVVMAH